MKYDAILIYETPVNESDERVPARGLPSDTRGFNSRNRDADDPRMYGDFTFGNYLRQSLNNMGSGYSSKVSDFKKWVVVEVTYHNHITTKSSSKTFLIVFKQKGNGMVLATHNRYRTISGADQAASYIKSACNALQYDTQNRVG